MYEALRYQCMGPFTRFTSYYSYSYSYSFSYSYIAGDAAQQAAADFRLSPPPLFF